MTPETVTSDWPTGICGQRCLLQRRCYCSALAVGLLVGIFQAATQINEMTMSFIPKLLVLVLWHWLSAGPWMLSVMINYTQQLFDQIPSLIS